MKKNKLRNNLDDEFYLDQTISSEPKETFKFIADIARNLDGDLKSWHDIGCGTGELLNYLCNILPGIQLSGSDVSSELIGVAKKKYPEILFSVNNFTDRPSSLKKDYDIVSLIGVHGRFKYLNSWLPQFTSLIKKHGYGLIFDLFNSEPVDVAVSAKKSDSQELDYENTYFNLISINSMKNELTSLGFKSKFYRFKMPFVIEKKNDPFRSWTIDLFNGERMLTNGLGQLFDFYLCVVKK